MKNKKTSSFDKFWHNLMFDADHNLICSSRGHSGSNRATTTIGGLMKISKEELNNY